MNLEPDYDADGYYHDELDDYYDWLVTQEEDRATGELERVRHEYES